MAVSHCNVRRLDMPGRGKKVTLTNSQLVFQLSILKRKRIPHSSLTARCCCRSLTARKLCSQVSEAGCFPCLFQALQPAPFTALSHGHTADNHFPQQKTAQTEGELETAPIPSWASTGQLTARQTFHIHIFLCYCFFVLNLWGRVQLYSVHKH